MLVATLQTTVGCRSLEIFPELSRAPSILGANTFQSSAHSSGRLSWWGLLAGIQHVSDANKCFKVVPSCSAQTAPPELIPAAL